MLKCPGCHHQVPEASRFCPACGAEQGISGAPTRVTSSGRSSTHDSSGSQPQGRFVSGAMLASRYRIIGLLGKGGMGEVYRADDLKLGQPVALKFLPEALAADPERLARFHNEVRLARQVSHPSVCRVYDIGEADGHHFISMEYVDGEDLASLLRRIGRLPRDKSVEIARQLCAGLAAAHERGVLHRDLKPANLMIDGRGKVRITDFGLAGVAGAIRGAEARAGTPTYMSPEQIAGGEVTVRSDVYGLGLVLYEMFTGKAAFRADTMAELARARQDSTVTTPSSLVPGLDPAVERVILRCLEKDPAARPVSALSVAAALPGGDPLAAALAAGETPSPEMVAAAAVEGGLSPAAAWSCLAAFVVLLAAVLVMTSRLGLVVQVPLDKPPDVLADRARDVLRRLGHTAPANDIRYSFEVDDEYLKYVESHDPSPHRWDRLSTGMPPAIYFWYRQSPAAMVSKDSFAVVAPNEPPLQQPGMALVLLDTRGHMIFYTSVPPQKDEPAAAPLPASAPDWSVLFDEAGLDIGKFVPTDAEWNPPVFADARAAWNGTLPGQPDVPIRIEAAGYHGKPIFFRGVGAWSAAKSIEPEQKPPAERIGQIIFVSLRLSALVGSIVLARSNLRLGRGDRSGAFKISLYFIIVHVIVWALWASHVPDLNAEWSLFARDTGWTLFNAAMLWLAYLGLEPYVRRLWPDTVISWNRLLAGRLRDPLVGRDILMGSLLGACGLLIVRLGEAAPGWFGLPLPIPNIPDNLFDFVSMRYALAHLVDLHVHALLDSMLALMLLLLLRVLLRRQWLAAVVFTILFALQFVGGPSLRISAALAIFGVSLFVFSLMRFGLIAGSVLVTNVSAIQAMQPTTDLMSWHAGSSILALVALLGIAIYGFHTALAGRPLFRALGQQVMEG